jgi:hypothetical protein
MLHKDYDRKGSVGKISGRESQRAWRQYELVGGKPPVLKYDSNSDSESRQLVFLPSGVIARLSEL